MAKDPVADLVGALPILELLERVAAKTIAIRTLSKSWVIHLSKSRCIVCNNHDTTFRLRVCYFTQSSLQSLEISPVLCVVVCNGPASDLSKVVGQVSFFRYERL